MFWVVIEGIDKAGKTTLGRELARRLAAEERLDVKYAHVFDTPVGRELRRIFLADGALDSLTETLLLSAARSAYVAGFIRPGGHDIVITDRFFDSIRSMQCLGDPRLDELVSHVSDVLDGATLTPDLILLLDVSPHVLSAPGTGPAASDRIEAMPAAFHERVRRQFLRLASESPRYVTLDAGMPPATVAEIALRAILKHYMMKRQVPPAFAGGGRAAQLCCND